MFPYTQWCPRSHATGKLKKLDQRWRGYPSPWCPTPTLLLPLPLVFERLVIFGVAEASSPWTPQRASTSRTLDDLSVRGGWVDDGGWDRGRFSAISVVKGLGC